MIWTSSSFKIAVSKESWDHLPFPFHRILAKLALIPFLGAIGRYTEIYSYKYQGAENSFVEKLSRWRSN